MAANKYPGKCICSADVPAGAGGIVKVAGKWAVRCAAHAPTGRPAGFARTAPRDAEWVTMTGEDGRTIRVHADNVHDARKDGYR